MTPSPRPTVGKPGPSSLYPALLEPIQLGSLVVKNRVEAAPSLPNLAGADGFVTRELVAYYSAKARGGAGIVTVGESAVDADYAPTHGGQLLIDHDNKIPGLNALAEGIKRYGARASLELCHAGRQTTPHLIGNRQPIAPSPVPSAFHEMLAGQEIAVQEMTPAMIEQVVENYADAALRLKRAGFDMVLLHGGHGWLLAQFLSPLTNKRTDEYGGTIEDRARFPLQVVRRIRERCGSDFAIEYRFSADEHVPGGLQLDEATRFTELIESEVDCLQVSCGMIGEPSTFPITHPACYLPHGRNVHLAKAIKARVGKPVTAVGAILDLDLAERIVSEGSADLVAMARALIADPELPKKGVSGRGDDIIPCIRCNECLARVAVYWPVKCAVNPTTGRETQYPDFGTAKLRKKVAVVGGGPAGMQAAVVSAERGHEVTLYEMSPNLGGNLFVASQPSFKDDMKRFLSYLIRTVESLPIDVRLGDTATPDTFVDESPDVLFVAAGAEPYWPAIPGADGENVFWAGDVFASRVDTGRRVVLAGGGATGCETALLLSQAGKEVVLVEQLPDLAEDANMVNRILLLKLLGEEGVDARTETTLQSITSAGVAVKGSDGREEEIPADSVVLALGMDPRRTVVDELAHIAPEFYAVGDCVHPRLVFNAIHEAFDAALEV